ncbi:MAG: LysR family transcriptional regulator [Pseudomonadota bacterium]
MLNRRYLPPTNWLAAFESVARLGSVTDASRELNLSQGAVSKLIKNLEDQLGVQLFLRERKKLVLTSQGESYVEHVKRALDDIRNATLGLVANPEGGTLELAILPAFGTQWLAPRLPAFLSDNPGIQVNLSTRVEKFDFSKERFHAAIHFGRDDWEGTDALRLMDESTIPIVAPELAAELISDPEGFIDRLPLLSMRSRPDVWTNWFETQGRTISNNTRMEFDQFAAMRQAAIAGIGAALFPDFVISEDLRTGRLTEIPNTLPSSHGSYFLVWPKSGREYPPLTALISWLRELDPDS